MLFSDPGVRSLRAPACECRRGRDEYRGQIAGPPALEAPVSRSRPTDS